MNNKSWIILVALVIFLGTDKTFAQNVGEAGPDFQVSTLGGGSFKLSDQQGKVVFVFLFGNTCPSCRVIGPTVESSIYQVYMSNPNFVAIGLDTWDSSSGESSVSGFQSSTGISFPLAIKAGSVASAYSTTYDRFMVIDSDGILVHKGSVVASNDVNNAKAAIEESLMVAGVSGRTAREAGVKVYPVPASDKVHFESEKTISQVRIYDGAGRLVLNESDLSFYGSGSLSLSVSTLKKGLYFYQLQRADDLVSGKFLVQR